jgi:hypothetical protein
MWAVLAEELGRIPLVTLRPAASPVGGYIPEPVWDSPDLAEVVQAVVVLYQARCKGVVFLDMAKEESDQLRQAVVAVTVMGREDRSPLQLRQTLVVVVVVVPPSSVLLVAVGLVFV